MCIRDSFSSVTPGVGTNTFEELNHPLGHLYQTGKGYVFGLHSTTHGPLEHGSLVAERVLQVIQGPLTGNYQLKYQFYKVTLYIIQLAL